MAEQPPLTLADQETISEAIFYLISSYPAMPFDVTQDTLKWQSIGTGEGIGLYTMQGSMYKAKYISGSYQALFPFRIIYNCNPTNSKGRLDSQYFLEDITAWLSTCNASLKNTHITIDKIERTSPVYKQDADNSGVEKYTCTVQVTYSYKK